jgi:hypothetical protein
MRTYILTLAFATLSIGAIGQDCTQLDFGYFGDVKGAVSRLLSLPGYTGLDEEILNRSGDSAGPGGHKERASPRNEFPRKREADSPDFAPGICGSRTHCWFL